MYKFNFELISQRLYTIYQCKKGMVRENSSFYFVNILLTLFHIKYLDIPV